MRELAALRAQFGELGALLESMEPDDWRRPTRCAPMDVLELTVHVVNVLPFWRSFLDATPDGEPTTDRVRWWGYDVEAESPKILARAQKSAAGRTPSDVLQAWRTESASLVDAYGAAPPDRMVGRAHLSMPLADLVAVGVVEVGVHTMDVGHAVLKGERLHDDAEGLVVEVLEGVLGSPMPPALGWSPKTFVLCATGRREISPTERHVLGPAAARFPLLA